RFSIFREDHSTAQSQFGNISRDFQHVFGNWEQSYNSVEMTYRSFPPDLVQNVWGYQYFGARRGYATLGAAPAGRAGGELLDFAATKEAGVAMDRVGALNAAMPVEAPAPAGIGGAAVQREPSAPAASSRPDLAQVSARKNLNETAFFFPQLMS